MPTLLQQKYPAVQCKKLYLPQGCALFCIYSVVCIYIPMKSEETICSDYQQSTILQGLRRIKISDNSQIISARAFDSGAWCYLGSQQGVPFSIAVSFH